METSLKIEGFGQLTVIGSQVSVIEAGFVGSHAFMFQPLQVNGFDIAVEAIGKYPPVLICEKLDGPEAAIGILAVTTNLPPGNSQSREHRVEAHQLGILEALYSCSKSRTDRSDLELERSLHLGFDYRDAHRRHKGRHQLNKSGKRHW